MNKKTNLRKLLIKFWGAPTLFLQDHYRIDEQVKLILAWSKKKTIKRKKTSPFEKEIIQREYERQHFGMIK